MTAELDELERPPKEGRRGVVGGDEGGCELALVDSAISSMGVEPPEAWLELVAG